MLAIAESESKSLSKTPAKETIITYVSKSFPDSSETKTIVDVLNCVAINNGNVLSASRIFKISPKIIIKWIDKFNSVAGVRNRIKRKRSYWAATDTKAKVFELHAQGVSVAQIAKKLKLKVPSIYSWLKKAKLEGNRHPYVSKVIEDIKNEQRGGASHSLASDFNIDANLNTRETSNSIEINFCPCCGTNIKAVLIALQACKELR